MPMRICHKKITEQDGPHWKEGEREREVLDTDKRENTGVVMRTYCGQTRGVGVRLICVQSKRQRDGRVKIELEGGASKVEASRI